MGKLRGKGGGGKTAQIITTKMEEEKKTESKTKQCVPGSPQPESVKVHTSN